MSQMKIDMRGRRKLSKETRAEQMRAAQERLRKKRKKIGLIPMQAYVAREVVTVVDKDAVLKDVTRGDRVELALRKFYKMKTGAAR
jgi:hypothetical protein